MRDFDIAVLFPPECIECLPEGYNASVRLRIVFGQSMQKNNSPHPIGLLRVRSHWPSRCCAAERDNEFSPPDMDYHVTHPHGGSSQCNEETIPRFDRVVCGYFRVRRNSPREF
jgi:hypothetical protein